MNTLNISKWMAGAAAAAAMFGAGSVLARDILLLDAGHAPDPRQVAAILAGTSAEPMKLRGVRVLNTAGNVAAAQAAAPAARVDCLPVARARPAAYKVRGVRLPADATAKAQVAEAGPECETQAAAQTVSEPGAAAVAASPARVHESIALMVPFRFNSAQIADEAISQLSAMAEGIKLAGPDVRIVIEGHTDAAGTDQYNLILSYLRASAVRDYLVREHGLPARNLKPVGMGKRVPLDGAHPGAPENRRVEFRVEQS